MMSLSVHDHVFPFPDLGATGPVMGVRIRVRLAQQPANLSLNVP